jgi:hypothetical protein
MKAQEIELKRYYKEELDKQLILKQHRNKILTAKQKAQDACTPNLLNLESFSPGRRTSHYQNLNPHTPQNRSLHKYPSQPALSYLSPNTKSAQKRLQSNKLAQELKQDQEQEYFRHQMIKEAENDRKTEMRKEFYVEIWEKLERQKNNLEQEQKEDLKLREYAMAKEAVQERERIRKAQQNRELGEYLQNQIEGRKHKLRMEREWSIKHDLKDCSIREIDDQRRTLLHSANINARIAKCKKCKANNYSNTKRT